MSEPRTVSEPPPFDGSRPLSEASIVYQHRLPNCPGKSGVGVLVNFVPNAATPPHRHAGASVCVYVIEGTVLNKMNDSPTRVLTAGESFFEAPGCHHRVSETYSATEGAKLLATMIVDTEIVEKGGAAALTQIDEEYLHFLPGGKF